jgi:propionate CoA-transferase
MDPRIFRAEPMGLRERLLAIPLERRLAYDPERNVLFINFERLAVRTREDIAAIRAEIEKQLQPLGRKIYAIVNYDNFTILPDLIDAWSEMVGSLVERYYWGVTRYATSGFLRAKLGESLAKRGVAPHLYESAEEARAYLQELERRAAL